MSVSVSKVAVSLLTTGALMASVIPAAAAATMSSPTVAASKARCDALAGREKTRCLTIQRRNSRMRLQNLDKHMTTGRKSTLREQRVITKNNSQRDIRSRGSSQLKSLRTHDLGAGNTRRAIMMRAYNAREACKEKTSTERYTCIRENMRSISQ